jgi:hypothetical protein
MLKAAIVAAAALTIVGRSRDLAAAFRQLSSRPRSI